MKAHRHLLLMATILALVAGPAILWASTPMTDTQKREAVDKMYAGYKGEFPMVTDITPQDAARLFAEQRVQFVDVREPEEIRISTLPGAIDKQRFLQDQRQYGDKTVVVFCTISYRSGLFAQELASQGVAVQNLAGGILAWVLAGGRVFDQDGESKRLHVYGPEWDLAPAEFETIKFNLLERLAK